MAPVRCPWDDACLAFYITSLTKQGTSRDAARQLKLALPLNLFLNLHCREWATFYVFFPAFGFVHKQIWQMILCLQAPSCFFPLKLLFRLLPQHKVVTFADDIDLMDWFPGLEWVFQQQFKFCFALDFRCRFKISSCAHTFIPNGNINVLQPPRPLMQACFGLPVEAEKKLM